MANIGKCFIGPSAMAGMFIQIRVCLSVFSSILLLIFPSIILSLLCFQKYKFSWNLHIGFFVIFGMGLGVNVELSVDFLKKNQFCAKMIKNGQKVAQKWDFSIILKNYVINFCFKH